MFEKFGRSIPQSLVDAVSRLMSEAKADEPDAPDADAIARRKRLQALKDKQEDERAERGEKSDDKPAVRKVAGSAYGGAKQKDDDLEEETEIEESRGHKIIANKLAQIDRMSSGVAPDHSTNVQSTKDKLKDAANIKKVEIVNQKDTSVKEDKDTVTKDASGKVTSWSHEGDWKKSTGKEGRGKSVHLSDLARRKSEKLAKEEVEPIEELSKKTLASYAKKASSSSDERSASNLSSRAAIKLAQSFEDGKDDGEKDDMKSFQRSKGIGHAVDRLARESVEPLDERQITQGSGSSPDPLVARIGMLRTIKNANGKSKPYGIERSKSQLKTAIKSTLDNKEHGKSKLPEEVELDEAKGELRKEVELQETATLDQYIKSLGYNPLNMEKNKKVMYSKTNAFKSYASRSEGASPGQDVDTSINPNATARG